MLASCFLQSGERRPQASKLGFWNSPEYLHVEGYRAIPIWMHSPKEVGRRLVLSLYLVHLRRRAGLTPRQGRARSPGAPFMIMHM